MASTTMMPGGIFEVVQKFNEFNASLAGMAAFTDWCEEENVEVPYLSDCDSERDRIAACLALWQYCKPRGISYAIKFDGPQIAIDVHEDRYVMGLHHRNIQNTVIEFVKSQRDAEAYRKRMEEQK